MAVLGPITLIYSIQRDIRDGQAVDDLGEREEGQPGPYSGLCLRRERRSDCAPNRDSRGGFVRGSLLERPRAEATRYALLARPLGGRAADWPTLQESAP